MTCSVYFGILMTFSDIPLYYFLRFNFIY